MARWFAAGVLAGMVITTVVGAAVGIHAFDVDPGDAQPAPEEDAPVAVEPVTPTPEPPMGIWDRLAACESSGNWHIATGNGYFGGLQFDLPSWRAAGGSGRPDQASRAEQIRVGQNWQRMRGWSAWPVCSRVIGVR